MDYFQGQNIWLLALSLFWALPWKGLALWRAVRFEHKRWFIAILVLNTFGIVEIIYLLFYNKIDKEQETAALKFIKSKAPFLHRH